MTKIARPMIGEIRIKASGILTFAVLMFCIYVGSSSGSAPEISQFIDSLSGEDAVTRFMAEERLVEMEDAAVSVLESLVTSSGFAPARQYAINLDIEGRWGLEGMKNHPDEKLRQAAMALLKEYDRLRR